MSKLNFPIAEIDGTKYQVQIDTTIYTKEAAIAATYKFTGKYFIHQQTNSDNPNIIDATFESKEGIQVTDSDVKEFCNELIDQQVRVDVNSKFGHIRDLIVEEAFKPITK